MGFKSALWDDSDPDYAPLANWTGNWCYWRPSKKYVALGYPADPVRLPGTKGDALGRERAAEARRLTRDMLASLGAAQKSVEAGTWDWLIHRYRTDPYSAYNDNIKANTKRGYDYTLDRWQKAIGHLPIRAMKFETIKTVEIKMREKGYTQSNIRRMFTMLRMLANYGTVLGNADAERVSSVLSRVRFSLPPKRSTTMTPQQARAMIDEADRRGMHSFALGMLMQWTYALRPIDVRGDWLPTTPDQGGIQRDGKRWQDGLTWEMIDPSLGFFEKVISKTAKSMPEAMRYALTPEIQSRIRLLANAGSRFGPLIVSERSGQPYTQSGWTQAFSRLRKAAGVPKDVWLMDARSGALTEAMAMGADPVALRDMGVHKNIDTTSGYIRQRAENIDKVVALRQTKKI